MDNQFYGPADNKPGCLAIPEVTVQTDEMQSQLIFFSFKRVKITFSLSYSPHTEDCCSFRVCLLSLKRRFVAF